jgi:histidinol phosphatase-like enzyme
LLTSPEQGFHARFDPQHLTPGAVDALFHATQAGWIVYLIGNEQAVASGQLSLERWQAFEQDLIAHLRSGGVPVRRSYACTDHPDGVPPHDKDSVFLLPNTGALYHAAQVDGIVLDQSWVVGDSTLELVAGWRAGCRLAGVSTGASLDDGEYPVDPEIVAEDLVGALREIVAGVGLSRRSAG